MNINDTLIITGHLSTLIMQRNDKHEPGTVRVWENGNYSATVSPERANEIIEERRKRDGEDFSAVIISWPFKTQ